MDRERYQRDPAYRRMVEGARKGGRSRSRRKLEAVKRNIAKAKGRPRKDGLSPGWQQRGLHPREAETEAETLQRGREARRKKKLMRDRGWSLDQEWEWSDTATDWQEEETETYLAREGAPGDRQDYVWWRDVECKNLCEEGELPPDSLLVALCRYRLLGGRAGAETRGGRPETGEGDSGGAETVEGANPGAETVEGMERGGNGGEGFVI